METKKSTITTARRRRLAINRIITNIRQLMELEPCDEIEELIEQHTRLLTAMYRQHAEASKAEMTAEEPSTEHLQPEPEAGLSTSAVGRGLKNRNKNKNKKRKIEQSTLYDDDALDVVTMSAANGYAPRTTASGKDNDATPRSDISSLGKFYSW